MVPPRAPSFRSSAFVCGLRPDEPAFAGGLVRGALGHLDLVVRGHLPALTVGAYIALGTAWFIAAHITRADYWDPFHIGAVTFWIACVTGLILRRYWALALLIAFEFVSLFGFVSEPGAWGFFVLEIALLLLLVSPYAQAYVRPPSSSKHARPRTRGQRVALLLIVFGLLLVAVAAGLAREPVAIPLAVTAGMLPLITRRIDALFGRRVD